VRVGLTAPDAVAGFRIRTRFRVEHRYSDRDLIQPRTAARIYEAALDRQFTSIPMRVELGRFHSSAESYSGYWDGLGLRVGDRSFAVGALAGFQPDRWNQNPAADRPKASVYVAGERSSDEWRWQGDLSAHLVLGPDSLPDHRFLGLSQRIRTGRIRINQDLQVDQDQTDGGVRISRLRVRGSLNLPAGLEATLGVSSHRGYSEWRSENIFGSRRDQAMAGLSYRGGRGPATAVGLTVTRSRLELGSDAMGYSGFTRLPLPLRAASTFHLGASLWTREESTVVSLSPSLRSAVGRTALSLGYRFYRSDFGNRTVTSHTGEIGTHFPVVEGLRGTARAGVRWSGPLRSEDLRISLTRSF